MINFPHIKKTVAQIFPLLPYRPVCYNTHTGETMVLVEILFGDKALWCQHNDLQLATESYRDYAGWGLHLRVYALLCPATSPATIIFAGE